jgi:cytosine deaminase
MDTQLLESSNNLGLLALDLKMRGSRSRGFLISAGKPEDKAKLTPLIKELATLGVRLYATEGTSRFLAGAGVNNEQVCRLSDECEPNPQSLLVNGTVDLVINILTGDDVYDSEKTDCRQIRRLATEQLVPVITEVDLALSTLEQLIRRAKAPKSGPPDYDFWAYFEELVIERGGMVNNHAHLDRAGTISREHFKLGHAKMVNKWDIVEEMRRGYTHDGLVRRMSHFLDRMITQGIHTCRTFVDIDAVVELKVVKAALEVKRRFAPRGFTLEIGLQPIKGLLRSEAGNSKMFYEEAAPMVDFLGALPSRDKLLEEQHLDFVMGLAKKYGKTVDVHVDQRNHPEEDETERLAAKAIEHELHGRVTAVHAISVACKMQHVRDRIIERMKTAKMRVVVCPSAAISMEQLDDLSAPIHNSIAPVIKFVEAGIPVSVGTDNIHDLFMPASAGILKDEIWMLAEAIRCYDVELLADIACNKLGVVASRQEAAA